MIFDHLAAVVGDALKVIFGGHVNGVGLARCLVNSLHDDARVVPIEFSATDGAWENSRVVAPLIGDAGQMSAPAEVKQTVQSEVLVTERVAPTSSPVRLNAPEVVSGSRGGSIRKSVL